MTPTPRCRLALFVGAIASSAMINCTDSTGPQAPAVASLVIVAGDAQTAHEGTSVPIRPSVQARDAGGNPIANTLVRFSVLNGTGAVAGGEALTNASGIATVGNWTLGSASNPRQQLSAVSGAAVATFSASVFGPPARVEIFEGNGQQAEVGSTVPVAPSIRVVDIFGNPVPGITVGFFVKDGGGTLTNAARVTGSDGVARLGAWTLGSTPGTQTLEAGFNTLTTIFTAMAVSPAVASIAQTTFPIVGAAGAELARVPDVLVRDRSGKAIPGVEVSFATGPSGGTIAGSIQRTDAGGRARVDQWTLGPLLGTHTLTASAGNVIGSVSVTATSGPPAHLTKVRGDLQRVVEGKPLPINPVVQVTDAEGRPAPNTRVIWAPTLPCTPLGTDWSGFSTYYCTGGQLPPAGSFVLTVRVGALVAQFTETILPVPASIAFITAPQSYEVAHDASIFAAVRVRLPDGSPAVGYPVSFTDYATDLTSVVTDDVGVASITWLPRPVFPPGRSVLRASLTGSVIDSIAVFVVAPVPFVDIAAGSSHTCAQNQDYFIYCWGSNTVGQIGDGSTAPRRLGPTPAVEPLAYRVRQLRAAGDHTCKLAERDRPRGVFESFTWCWGRTRESTSVTNVPVVVTDDRYQVPGFDAARLDGLVVQRVDGQFHACALSNKGSIYCWGRNSSGELGDGTTIDRAGPVPVAGGVKFATIQRTLAVGGAHTCARADDGDTYCWGRNDRGQLGTASTTTRATPTKVVGALSFVQIAAGAEHTCGIVATGEASCWGANSYGQLGNASVDDDTAPRPVLGGLRFSRIAAGGFHSCAIQTTSRFAFCWGRNNEGQLGDATRTDRLTPVAVSDLRPSSP